MYLGKISVADDPREEVVLCRPLRHPGPSGGSRIRRSFLPSLARGRCLIQGALKHALHQEAQILELLEVEVGWYLEAKFRSCKQDLIIFLPGRSLSRPPPPSRPSRLLFLLRVVELVDSVFTSVNYRRSARFQRWQLLPFFAAELCSLLHHNNRLRPIGKQLQGAPDSSLGNQSVLRL